MDTLRSPDQISDHLRVTYVPTYLLATAAIVLLATFIVWGVLGSVSDKVYFSGVVFPAQGTTDITLPNKGIVRSMMVSIACIDQGDRSLISYFERGGEFGVRATSVFSCAINPLKILPYFTPIRVHSGDPNVLKPAMQVVAIIHHQQLLAGSIPVNSTTTTTQFSREFGGWDWDEDEE